MSDTMSGGDHPTESPTGPWSTRLGSSRQEANLSERAELEDAAELISNQRAELQARKIGVNI